MKNRLLAGLILVAALALFGCEKKEYPHFDAQKAFAYLVKQTEFGPRNPGSEGANACREWLVTELENSADRVTTQPFEHFDDRDSTTYKLTNIIASYNLNPDVPRILLMAHWDTRPWADQDDDPANHDKPVLGANDGASGVAVLLQVGAVLKENPPDLGVDIVLFDGEDAGQSGTIEYWCWGSKFFAKNLGSYKPQFGILLDMVGEKNAEFPFEGNSLLYSDQNTRRLWAKAKELGLTAFIEVNRGQIYDDHVPLNQAGVKSTDIIDIDYDEWHTANDTPDKCSPESLEQVGKLLMAIIYE